MSQPTVELELSLWRDAAAMLAEPGSQRDALDAVSRCRVVLTRPDPAFANTISEWGFLNTPGGPVWQGRLYGADRLRFLGVLSRYSALIKSVHIDEVEQKVDASNSARIA